MALSKLRICNFVSFTGSHEVTLPPFATVACASERGRNDFVAAIKFVLGADLNQFGFQHPMDFYGEEVVDSSLVTDLELPVVSVEAQLSASDGRSAKFGRFVINNNIEHRVDEVEVTLEEYMEQLLSLGFTAGGSSDSWFVDEAMLNSILWESGGLERGVICFLGLPRYLPDVPKLKRELTVLERSEQMLQVKKYHTLSKDLRVVEIANSFEKFFKQQDSRLVELLTFINKELHDEETGLENTNVLSNDSMSPSLQPVLLPLQLYDLMAEEQNLYEEVVDRNLNCAHLQAQIFSQIVQLKKISDDSNDYDDIVFKKEAMESQIDDFSTKEKEISEKLAQLSEQIGFNLALIEEHRNDALSLDVSPYGRLSDLLGPTSYLWIIKHVLGSYLDAHILDSSESSLVSLLHEKKWEKCETFIYLNDYSHKLRETLFAGGESKIDLRDIVPLQVFLFELKVGRLISDVPKLCLTGSLLEGFNPKENSVIFVETGEIITVDGTMGRLDKEPPNQLITLENLRSVVQELKQEEQDQYDQLRAIQVEKEALLRNIECAENELQILDRIYRKPRAVCESLTLEIPSIYDEYLHHFNENPTEVDRLPNESEEYLEISNETLDVPAEHYDSSPNESEAIERTFEIGLDLATLKKDHEILERNLNALLKNYKDVRSQLSKNFIKCTNLNLKVRRPCMPKIPRVDKDTLIFDLEIAQLSKIVNKDDVDYLQGGKKWIDDYLNQLGSELTLAKKNVQTCKAELEDLLRDWENSLSPAMNYCNALMSQKLAGLLGGLLSHATLTLGADANLQLMLSVWGVPTDVYSTNSFLRTMALLCLLLSLARLQNKRLVVADSFGETLPRTDKDVFVATALDRLSEEQIDGTRFRLCKRIGGFIKSFLSSGTTQEAAHGLGQVLMLTKGDEGVMADSYVIVYERYLEGPMSASAMSVIDLPE